MLAAITRELACKLLSLTVFHVPDMLTKSYLD